jgi:hypothetical protein
VTGVSQRGDDGAPVSKGKREGCGNHSWQGGKAALGPKKGNEAKWAIGSH